MMTTLTHYGQKDFALHAYVIMPDHLHLLITSSEAIEKSVQLIKGGFSFRAKRELEWKTEIWQQGFTDHRVRDEEDWQRHLEYIRTNPIEARLVEDSVLYEYMSFPDIAFPQGLKPSDVCAEDVRAEARTLHTSIPYHPRVRETAGDVRAEAHTLHTSTPDLSHVRETLKGTGFSPSIKATLLSRALAHEGDE
jgi:putative transposase